MACILGPLQSLRGTAYYHMIVWALESEIRRKGLNISVFEKPFGREIIFKVFQPM